MYRLCRLMLILAVLAITYCVVVLAIQLGGLVCIGIGVLAVSSLARRGYGKLTAYGTARWADANDLRKAGMLGAKSGLIIGRVSDGGNP